MSDFLVLLICFLKLISRDLIEKFVCDQFFRSTNSLNDLAINVSPEFD